jgi:hypothetical protein
MKIFRISEFILEEEKKESLKDTEKQYQKNLNRIGQSAQSEDDNMEALGRRLYELIKKGFILKYKYEKKKEGLEDNDKAQIDLISADLLAASSMAIADFEQKIMILAGDSPGLIKKAEKIVADAKQKADDDAMRELEKMGDDIIKNAKTDKPSLDDKEKTDEKVSK